MATAAAVASDASPRRIRRSRLTSRPRWLAAVSPSRNPSRIRARSASTRHAPRISGAATSRRVHEDPPRPPEQEREDLAEVGPRDVHRHRQERGEHRADRVAREQQPGEPAGPAGAADAEDEVRGRERTREREPVEQAELDHHEPDRDEDRDGRAEGGTGRRAEDVRVGQRVADQALQRGAGHGETRAHQHGRQDPRHPQVPHDRLGGLGPGPPEVETERPPQDDADGVAGTDPGRPERHPGDEQHRQCDESRDGDQSRAPPDAARPGRAFRGRERAPSRTPHAQFMAAGGEHDVGVHRQREVPQAGRQTRPRTGDLGVLDRPDVAVLDRGQHRPPGALRDDLGRRGVEGVDAQEDDLRGPSR